MSSNPDSRRLYQVWPPALPTTWGLLARSPYSAALPLGSPWVHSLLSGQPTTVFFFVCKPR